MPRLRVWKLHWRTRAQEATGLEAKLEVVLERGGDGIGMEFNDTEAFFARSVEMVVVLSMQVRVIEMVRDGAGRCEENGFGEEGKGDEVVRRELDRI